MTTARERMVRVVAEALTPLIEMLHGTYACDCPDRCSVPEACRLRWEDEQAEAVVAALEAQMGLRETVPLANGALARPKFEEGGTR